MKAKRYQITAADLIEAVKQATRGTEAEMPDDATRVSAEWIAGRTRALVVTIESDTCPEATVGLDMFGHECVEVEQVRITHIDGEWKAVRRGLVCRG